MDMQDDVKVVATGLDRVVSASLLTKKQIAERAGIRYEKFLMQLEGDARIEVLDFMSIASVLGMRASALMAEIESLKLVA